MLENFSIAIRLLNIQNDKIANAMLAPCGLSHAQFKVLNLLFARPAFSLRQVDIEDFFQISNPTVTGILRSLEKKGLIERKTNPDDSRSKLIGTTEEAEAMREELHRIERTLSDRIDSMFTEEEKKQFLGYLNRIIESQLSAEELYRYREPEDMKY